MENFKLWLKCALVRALKTVAQTMIATIGTSVALGDVDWRMVLSASILAGILSILTSVAGLPEVENVKLSEDEYYELTNGIGDDEE